MHHLEIFQRKSAKRIKGRFYCLGVPQEGGKNFFFLNVFFCRLDVCNLFLLKIILLMLVI